MEPGEMSKFKKSQIRSKHRNFETVSKNFKLHCSDMKLKQPKPKEGEKINK
jgi:hypothetical protein